MRFTLSCLLLFLSSLICAQAEDWPTDRHDVSRTGCSNQTLSLPLVEVWQHEAVYPPRPAWPAPAVEDVSHGIRELSPTHIFDRAYHVVGVQDRLWYGSSADDSIVCLNADTGEILWTFIAEGPVRFSPTVDGDRILFGSDDGCVRCLNASDGQLLWTYRLPEDRRLSGNGRMISRQPIRSGVAVADNVAYFTAGLFPENGVFLCAVSADSGAEIWKRPIQVPCQGYITVSPQALFLPTGRTAPAAFLRQTGEPLPGLKGLGSCFALVLDDMVVSGPDEQGTMSLNTPDTRERMVSMPGFSLVAGEGKVFVLRKDEIAGFDRAKYVALGRQVAVLEREDRKTWTQEKTTAYAALKKEQSGCEMWKQSTTGRYELIRVGDLLLAGGDGEVVIHSAQDGKLLWKGSVSGSAHSVSVVGDRLLVSTDQGILHCFKPGSEKTRVRTVRAEDLLSEVPGSSGGHARSMAKAALSSCDSRQGYCLVLGAEDCKLVKALAKESDFQIVVAETDPAKAAEARMILAGSGLCGVRVSVHVLQGDQLPYPDYFANLIVASDDCAPKDLLQLKAGELARVMRPCGGVAFLQGKACVARWADAKEGLPGVTMSEDWAVAKRGPLEGAGEWTHTYAEPGNSACSQDRLVQAPFEILWFGEPGPRRMVDRHFRNVPPLAQDGRLFIPGRDIVYGVDAYNGTLLWQKEIPDSRRLAVFLDTSHMMLLNDKLHMAVKDQCLRIDAATGEEKKSFSLPSVKDLEVEWGYLAGVGERILGSVRRAGTTYQNINREANFSTEAAWYPNMKLATSESVFGLDEDTGKLLWTYASGRLIDTTFAVQAGKLYFVETHSAPALADQTGRLTMRDMTRDGEQFLVALDVATGATLFKKAIDIRILQQPSYVNCADGVVLLSGSIIKNGERVVSSGRKGELELKGGESIEYSYLAFDGETGESLWRTTDPCNLSVDGGHGEYNRHPTLIDGVAYGWPYAYDLKTGQRKQGWEFSRHGHGCGGISSCPQALFWRGGNPWTWDLRPGGIPQILSAATRPGCWINILPAQGLVLVPEASSGCTCGFSIQTSLAFIPKKT